MLTSTSGYRQALTDSDCCAKEEEEEEFGTLGYWGY